MKPGKMDPMLKPLCWLIGEWRSVAGTVNYPTMRDPVHYCENLQFRSVGQPILNYSSVTWHPHTKKPMHLENGFLRIGQDGQSVILFTAQNFGCSTVEEGCVRDKTIALKTINIAIGKMAKGTFIELQRHYRLNEDGKLEMAMYMATPKVRLTKHLTTMYERVK